MELANTIIGALGDVLLVVTLVYVVRTLVTANGTRTDAQTADQAGSRDRQEAARLQKDAIDRAEAAAIAAAERDKAAATAADERARAAAIAAEAAAVAADERDKAAAKRQQAANWLSVLMGQIAGLEQRRERVQAVGQIVEDLFWTLHPWAHDLLNVGREQWMPYRNSLRHLMVGLKSGLPNCARILDAGTASVAYDDCVGARLEVERELESIDTQLNGMRTQSGSVLS